jgi:hypothetical protein
MDYTDDLCMWEFTSEQARRLRCTVEYWRPDLFTSVPGLPYTHINFDGADPPGVSVSSTGLWHITTGCQPGSCFGLGGSNHAYYGNDGACNYHTGFNANSGTLSIQRVPVPQSATTFFCCYHLDTELTGCGWKYDQVDVFVNGTHVADNFIICNLIEGTTTLLSIDIQAWAGQIVTLDFAFDTVDWQANSYYGWSIDDIVICDLTDCNGNGVPDAFDIISGLSSDADSNGIPDECEIDCNGNGIPDNQDIANGTSADCNGDGIPDECEIADDPTLDWNGDGILDECTSPNYCTANPNSTGLPAVMSVSGSPIITDNNFTITASRMPKFEWGYFLMAGSQGFIPNVGGSGGNLCLGFPFYRFSKFPTGQIISSGADGTFSFSPNLTNLPQGVVFMIGETWDFQAWYRDGAASTSNFTDGIEVMFR